MTLVVRGVGIAVTLALTRFPGQVGRLYAADLVGAALGCILLLYTLEITDGPTAVVFVAALLLVGLLALALRNLTVSAFLATFVVLLLFSYYHVEALFPVEPPAWRSSLPVLWGILAVGAVLVSSHVHDLLLSLAQASFSDVSLYDLEGRLIDTTLPGDEKDSNALALSSAQVRALRAAEGASSRQTLTLHGLKYDLWFGVFWARGNVQGFYSVALSRSGRE